MDTDKESSNSREFMILLLRAARYGRQVFDLRLRIKKKEGMNDVHVHSKAVHVLVHENLIGKKAEAIARPIPRPRPKMVK